MFVWELGRQIWMCNGQYFSENEDQCSQVMKQTVKEVFENNIHHDAMKIIPKAYMSNWECSVKLTWAIFTLASVLSYFAKTEA